MMTSASSSGSLVAGPDPPMPPGALVDVVVGCFNISGLYICCWDQKRGEKKRLKSSSDVIGGSSHLSVRLC